MDSVQNQRYGGAHPAGLGTDLERGCMQRRGRRMQKVLRGLRKQKKVKRGRKRRTCVRN